jgi:DNA-binding response OmpR family regulator
MFLTAMGAIDDRVRGLDSGADDYMAKPFVIAELLARVRALLRRPKASLPDRLTAGSLTLDLRSQTVQIQDREVDLTSQDRLLLSALMRNPARVFTREALLDHMGGGDDITPAAVEHAISRLRKKLALAGAANLIETVRGVGYRFSA